MYDCKLVKNTLVLALVMLISGCATTIQDLEDTLGQIKKNQRAPGEKSLALPDKIWLRHQCDQAKLPWFNMEAFEVTPRRLSAGEDFNLRMIYALCSNKRADEITGSLYTKIYYQGKAIVNDVNRRYSIKPGRWQVDTFVTVPEQAEPGVYSIEVEFHSRLLKIVDSMSFVVR